MLLVKQWLLSKVLKGIHGEKVIKMHFHYLLLHISGPWTIHLIGCIFFNKFTTNAFILICFTHCSFSLPETVAAEFKYHFAFHVFFPALSFWRNFSRLQRDCFRAPYLVNHRHIGKRSSNWSLQSVWPCVNRAAAQFWRTGSRPAAEIFEQLWHSSGWHFPHSVCFN